jgi:hypothetical protein
MAEVNREKCSDTNMLRADGKSEGDQPKAGQRIPLFFVTTAGEVERRDAPIADAERWQKK